jgi:hypothetical protein
MPARNVLQYQDWGWFTSQISSSGSGMNNCGPASIVAAALAANTVDRNRSWQSLIDEAAWNCRHEPNTNANDYVSYPELERALDAWNIEWDFTYDYGTAMNSPWSIVLCSGATIRLADGSQFYPDSWFGGSYEPNHFCVWGPAMPGQPPYSCMNPLSYYPGDTWVQVEPSSWQRAFGSAHLLRGLPTAEPAPPPPPEQLSLARFRCIREEGFWLKPTPASGGANVEHGFVAMSEEGTDTGARVADAADPNVRWGYLQYGGPDGWAEGWTISNSRYFERLP